MSDMIGSVTLDKTSIGLDPKGDVLTRLLSSVLNYSSDALRGRNIYHREIKVTRSLRGEIRSSRAVFN